MSETVNLLDEGIDRYLCIGTVSNRYQSIMDIQS